MAFGSPENNPVTGVNPDEAQRWEDRIPTPEDVEVRPSGHMGLGLFATRDFAENEVVFSFNGKAKRGLEASAFALQIDEDLFWESVPEAEFENLLNHNCQPNCFVRFEADGIHLITLRPINEGEQLSFDYNTTEWDLVAEEQATQEICSFACQCGSANCVGRVEGFNRLPLDRKYEILSQVSPYVPSKFLRKIA